MRSGSRKRPRRHQLRRALSQPQLAYAEALDELADRAAVARRPGMGQRRPQTAPADQRQCDPLVQGSLAGRILDGEPLETVIPEQWVHAPRGGVLVQRRQQAIQRQQSRDPRPGLARPEHVVHQVRIDRVEDRQVQQDAAVLRRQIAQQAHADVVLGEDRRVRAELPPNVAAQVAMDHQRDRPAARALLDRRQLAPGQRAVEELRDIGSGETELLRTDDDRLAVQQVRRQVELRIGTERHRHVEIGRRVLQQQVERAERAARQAIDLVEHEQARRRVRLDRAGQHPHPVHARRRRRGVLPVEQAEVQTGLFEGVDQVAAEYVRRVVAVQRHPPDDPALRLRVPRNVRQHGRLAEPGRRAQHGEAPREHPLEPLEQRRSAHVAARQIGRRHLGLEEPRRHDARRGDALTG